MADIQSIQRKLPRIEDEVRQYFLHNSFDLEKETIKAIKQTVNNIVKHAITAKIENELVKDLVLLEKLFRNYRFDEGHITPTFCDVKFDLEMDFQEVVEVEILNIKEELDSEKEKEVVYSVKEQKLLDDSKIAPSKLDLLLNQYKNVKKK